MIEFLKREKIMTDNELKILSEKLKDFLGKKGVRFFQLLHTFHRGIPLVIKLNVKRKFIPVHTIHLREGMQIRNFLRTQPECKNWDDNDFDNNWIEITTKAVNR